MGGGKTIVSYRILAKIFTLIILWINFCNFPRNKYNILPIKRKGRMDNFKLKHMKTIKQIPNTFYINTAYLIVYALWNLIARVVGL